MPDRAHDLLRDPLLHVRLHRGEPGALTLPGALALLGSDGIDDFTGLRPHHAQPWHAFLVQLAALALHHAGEEAPPTAEAAWTELLLGLTGGAAEPYCLMVEDPARPALLQPPLPGGDLGALSNRAETPDALDMLVTAKNHDVKAARMTRSRPEHWLYSLLCLQTMQGYSGKSNYGIARMNGGSSSRPQVALAPGLGWGPRFRRDLAALQGGRPVLVQSHGYPEHGGLGLLWLEPWDGEQSLPLTACDPYFIEVCRRVRLLGAGDGALCAAVGNSQATRLLAKDRNGDVGDPWIPVKRAEAKALTVSSSGFTYKLTQELLMGGEFAAPLAQRPVPGDSGPLLFLASVLVRGQGKTEGLHQRVVPVPGRASLALGSPAGRDRLGRLATQRVKVAETVRTRVLRPALQALMQGAPDRLDQRDDSPRPFCEALDRAVDEIFFERLWRDMDLPEEEGSVAWAREVIRLAEGVLERAIPSVPLSSARRYRAVAVAQRVFAGAARNKFPDCFSRTEKPQTGAA